MNDKFRCSSQHSYRERDRLELEKLIIKLNQAPGVYIEEEFAASLKLDMTYDDLDAFNRTSQNLHYQRFLHLTDVQMIQCAGQASSGALRSTVLRTCFNRKKPGSSIRRF